MVKAARAVFAPFITIVHEVELGTGQSPVQPAKTAPAFGAAVSVTEVFVGYDSEQSLKPLPQLIPGPVTRPLPVKVTERSCMVVVDVLNVAPTVLDELITTVQVVAVPVHELLQPENVAPLEGSALSVTLVLVAYVSEQSVKPAPQSMPVPVTRPLPVGLTVSVAVELPPLKVAETLLEAFIVSGQVVDVPVQEPPQPVKVAPAAGVSVSVTEALSA